MLINYPLNEYGNREGRHYLFYIGWLYSVHFATSDGKSWSGLPSFWAVTEFSKIPQNSNNITEVPVDTVRRVC